MIVVDSFLGSLTQNHFTLTYPMYRLSPPNPVKTLIFAIFSPLPIRFFENYLMDDDYLTHTSPYHYQSSCVFPVADGHENTKGSGSVPPSSPRSPENTKFEKKNNAVF